MGFEFHGVTEKSKNRVARPQNGDWGMDNEDCDDCWMTTESMPQSGHDTPLDKDQQSYQNRNATGRLALLASRFEKAGGSKILARKLRELDRQVVSIVASTDNGYPDYFEKTSFSTQDMELPGAGLSGGSANDSAIDDSQEPGHLGFYGTKPVRHGQAGPEPEDGGKLVNTKIRESSKKKTSSEEDDYEERECGMCGGPLGELGTLGRTKHYRCRDCGAQWSVTPKKEEEKKKNERKASTNNKSRRTASAEPLWDVFKASLRKAARGRRMAGGGSYRLSSEDYGNALQVSYFANQSDGAPVTTGTLTFSLMGEDRKNRTASIRVEDPVVTKRSASYRVKEAGLRKFGQDWVEKLASSAEKVLA